MDIHMLLSGMSVVIGNLHVLAYRGILRNKPINSTDDASGYYSKHGTDGNYRKGVVLTTTDGPFFQVDLQELYIVLRVIVTSNSDNLAYTVRNAKVGVSETQSSFYQCGQYPPHDLPPSKKDKHGFTMDFPCSKAGPARYVKIWNERKTRLALMELDADGIRVPTCAAYEGILRNKSFSSTDDASGYYSRYGTDGTYRKGVVLTTTDGPFFLVDLQELYIVLRVFVTGLKNGVLINTLKTAMIGVSKNGDRFTHCGQWPIKGPPEASERVYGFTLEFPCSHAGPVRYVKIWKHTRGRLSFAEIDAEGVQITQNKEILAVTMRRVALTRVKNSTSVSASSLTHCATLCRLQFCRFFSFSKQEHPNCLLADSGSTVRDTNWNSWSCAF